MKAIIISAILAGTLILTAVSGCSKAHTAISVSDTLSEMKYEQANLTWLELGLNIINDITPLTNLTNCICMYSNGRIVSLTV